MASLPTPQMHALGSPTKPIPPAMEAAPTATESLSGVFVANETKHLADRLQTALVKVKRLNRLEAALVDVFAEVMERTGSAEAEVAADSGLADHEAAFRRRRRKETLLKKAEGDPMSLLNALRTHLRVQFATLDQQQRQVAQNMSAIASRSQVRDQDARDEIRQLEAASNAMRAQMAVLGRQVAVSEVEKDRLNKQHQSFLDKARVQLKQTREQLREAQRTAEQQEQQLRALKDSNDQLITQLKSREEGARSPYSPSSALIASVVASNASIQRSGSTVGVDLVGNTPAENHKLRRALREYEGKLDKAEAAREELRGEVQRLHKQIVGYRQSTQTQSFVRLEKEERRLNELAAELKRKLAESDADLLRTRGALKEREVLVQQMKDEYGKLFSALQGQKTPQVSPGKLTRGASCAAFGVGVRPAGQSVDVDALGAVGKARGRLQAANDHPYLVEHYCVKVEELERQVDGLQVQIRKMIASDYRHKQQNRLFRVEKKQLVDACEELRADLEKAVLTTAKTMTTTTKVLATSEATISPSSTAVVSEVMAGGSKTQRTSASGTLNEVKRLRQRNQFLEERFRAVLHAAGRSSRVAASRDKDVAEEEQEQEEEEEEEPAVEAVDHKRAEKSERSNNAALSNEDGSSVGERERLSVGETTQPEVFRSIDQTMLASLQQVKRTARVRPNSAAVASSLRR